MEMRCTRPVPGRRPRLATWPPAMREAWLCTLPTAFTWISSGAAAVAPEAAALPAPTPDDADCDPLRTLLGAFAGFFVTPALCAAKATVGPAWRTSGACCSTS